MEFLKANGIEDHSFVKEMDYQEVLNSQEIFGDELAMFARKELQKEASALTTRSLLSRQSGGTLCIIFSLSPPAKLITVSDVFPGRSAQG